MGIRLQACGTQRHQRKEVENNDKAHNIMTGEKPAHPEFVAAHFRSVLREATRERRSDQSRERERKEFRGLDDPITSDNLFYAYEASGLMQRTYQYGLEKVGKNFWTRKVQSDIVRRISIGFIEAILPQDIVITSAKRRKNLLLC